MAIIKITQKQHEQFNRMMYALQKIAKYYQSPSQLRKSAEKEYGLDYEEALEMSYENIQQDAKNALKGIRQLNH